MMETMLTIVIFLLLILVIVWMPFMRQKVQQGAEENRKDANIALYKEHRAEITADLEQGAIDEESYEYLIEELDKSLMLDLEANEKQAAVAASNKPLSIAWPLVTSVFVLIFSFAVYFETGAYKALEDAQQMTAAQGHQQLDEQQQMMVRIGQLKQATQENPDDSEAWYSLGQAYIGAGEFELAIGAFDQVIRIEGEQADLLGAKAQATYYAANQNITTEVQQLIDAALAKDPSDPSTNILLGMHNFMNQQYQQAIDYWQKVVDDGRPSVNLIALEQAIAEAKNRLSLTGEAPQPAESATGPQLQIEVSLTEEIFEQLAMGEDKVVFVYATPVDGGRMPLAALKLKASDLPTTVVLNDARAMTPAAKLSDAQSVHLYAIVSSSGGAGIKSGDFKAEALNVSVTTTDVIQLVVNSVVP